MPPKSKSLPPDMETLNLDELTLDAANVRKHTDRNRQAIASSLKRFGAGRSIVLSKDNRIVAGNGTVQAAREIGTVQEVLVVEPKPGQLVAVRRSDLTESELTALAIADNRTSDLAEWHELELAQTLRALQSEEFDLDAAGFTPDELDKMLEQLGTDLLGPETIEDTPPEPPKIAVTRPGDIWIMGGHRLLCGDSANPSHVQELMNGQRAALMNTDPPYGVSYANEERPVSGDVSYKRKASPKVENDNLEKVDLETFLVNCFQTATQNALIPSAAWYIWHAFMTSKQFMNAAEAVGVKLSQQIIWVKNNFAIGRCQFHWKHEPAFFGWMEGNQPPDYGAGNGERNQTTVWEVPLLNNNERAELNHASPKPVGLFTLPILKHTQPGEICYEPFAGSGPQVIAAEQLGRKCYALELNPIYCDVIVKRWENFTGQIATRKGGTT